MDDMLRDGWPAIALECSSPRHAGLVVVTGCWTPELGGAGLEVIAQAPSTRRLALVGDCALGRGFIAEVLGLAGGVGERVTPDLLVPGCPVSFESLVEGVRDVAS